MTANQLINTSTGPIDINPVNLAVSLGSNQLELLDQLSAVLLFTSGEEKLLNVDDKVSLTTSGN